MFIKIEGMTENVTVQSLSSPWSLFLIWYFIWIAFAICIQISNYLMWYLYWYCTLMYMYQYVNFDIWCKKKPTCSARSRGRGREAKMQERGFLLHQLLALTGPMPPRLQGWSFLMNCKFGNPAKECDKYIFSLYLYWQTLQFHPDVR